MAAPHIKIPEKIVEVRESKESFYQDNRDLTPPPKIKGKLDGDPRKTTPSPDFGSREENTSPSASRSLE